MTEKIRRAFVAATPAPGDRVALDAEESHHLTRVLRLAVGDRLSVFDGKGGAWEARIDSASRDGVAVVVGPALAEEIEPTLRVVLFQSIARPEKIEWVLQKGTEIGVAAFRLIATERVEAPPPSPSRLERYRKIVLEACKQSGRNVVPDIALGNLVPLPAGVLAILLLPDAGPSLGARLAGAAPREVWLAIGPEGGFAEAERHAAEASGWRSASLGPRVLRTETAGVVAAAIVLHRFADLGA